MPETRGAKVSGKAASEVPSLDDAHLTASQEIVLAEGRLEGGDAIVVEVALPQADFAPDVQSVPAPLDERGLGLDVSAALVAENPDLDAPGARNAASYSGKLREMQFESPPEALESGALLARFQAPAAAENTPAFAIADADPGVVGIDDARFDLAPRQTGFRIGRYESAARNEEGGTKYVVSAPDHDDVRIDQRAYRQLHYHAQHHAAERHEELEDQIQILMQTGQMAPARIFTAHGNKTAIWYWAEEDGTSGIEVKFNSGSTLYQYKSEAARTEVEGLIAGDAERWAVIKPDVQRLCRRAAAAAPAESLDPARLVSGTEVAVSGAIGFESGLIAHSHYPDGSEEVLSVSSSSALPDAAAAAEALSMNEPPLSRPAEP